MKMKAIFESRRFWDNLYKYNVLIFFQLFQSVANFVKLAQTYEKLSWGLELYSYLVNLENSITPYIFTFSRILYELIRGLHMQVYTVVIAGRSHQDVICLGEVFVGHIARPLRQRVYCMFLSSKRTHEM